MVNIVAQFFIQEGKLEEALKVITELVEKTRQEAGCIKYEVYQDDKDSNHLILLEEWESQAILDKHSASDHFKALVPKIGELSGKPADIVTMKSKI